MTAFFFVKVSAADCFHNVFTKKQFSSSFVFSAGVLFVCGETVYCRFLSQIASLW